MSKRSGEQARRERLTASMARYDHILNTRDKWRLVHALRSIANRLETEAKAQDARLRSMPLGGLSVTDHAVCRFLERVMGWDLLAIRKEIASTVPLNALPPVECGVGSHSIYTRDGFQFLLTPRSVISVLSPGMDGSPWLDTEELELVGAT